MTDAVKDVAREAASNDVVRGLARAGYAANGLMHMLIGVIVLVIAFGGRGETDQAGAFKAIAAAPLGFAALWLLALGLVGLGAWHVVAGILARGPGSQDGRVKRWGIRISEWGQAIVFFALGAIAIAVAIGARPDAEEAAENASRGVLAIPGGPFLLAAVGLGVGVGGIVFVAMGVLRSFEKRMSIPGDALGDAVKTLGIVGFIAKGAALTIIGVLLVVAAVTLDADTAGGLDGAVQALLALQFGPWLAGAVGVGFLAYGVFCLFRARFARL